MTWGQRLLLLLAGLLIGAGLGLLLLVLDLAAEGWRW